MKSEILCMCFLLLLHVKSLSSRKEEICRGRIEDCETSLHGNEGKICPYPPPDLGHYIIDTIPYPIEELNSRLSEVTNGGIWKPPDCTARQRVAILVPYRDRKDHLHILLNNLHPFLQKQLIEYRIIVVEQADSKHFNKGALLNIAYTESMELNNFDCIILHDVDHYPENSQNLYMCDHRATHMVSKQRYLDRGYRERYYQEYFGAVVAISTENFRKINGFSNTFWGWGSEDDDFYNRVKHHKIQFHRVQDEVGGYAEVWHPKGFVNPKRHEVNKDGKNRWDEDGLNSLNYELIEVVEELLYTKLVVNLLDQDPYQK